MTTFLTEQIVLSKTKRMVDVNLALLANVSGNSRVNDLIAIVGLKPS